MNKISFIIIFSFLISTAYAGEWIQVVTDSSTLKIDTQKIESNLWQHLGGIKTFKLHSKETYTYQYQKIDKDVIYINAFCNKQPPDFELGKYLLVVKDGGPCYFQIKYNINTGQFFDLYVNGEA